MRLDNCLFQDADLDLVEITLSRRNLTSLLAKLDGHPPNSALTITKQEGDTNLIVHAEEDDTHYSRPEGAAGIMHGETEKAIAS